MKIQGLAVMAMLIIIPMSILLNSYSKNQIKTLQFQISYDSKLKNSTYDGVKALQLNMENSTTSDLANSKMRDIKAAIKTFYGSLAGSFKMTGYGEDVLKNYVPAIVYTMYDGYYIYSEYTNNIDVTMDSSATYQNGDELYGLKPYIYYSSRYKGSNFDVVITYSLDSYITIQGIVANKNVNESGYLLTNLEQSSGGSIKYNGAEIINGEGEIKQNVIYDEDNNSQENNTYNLPQIRVNGVKYYYDSSTNQIFSMLNNERLLTTEKEVKPSQITNNTTAQKFYSDACEFKKKFKAGGDLNALLELTSDDAVDQNGEPYKNDIYTKNIKIFGELENGPSSKSIEDNDSNFSVHKKEVIRNSIETNLMVAIENYNKVSSVNVKFAMPKLSATEWDEITRGISMITFMQGLNIGGKIYNGYAIVQNNVNDDFVSEDSIYIADTSIGSEKYYRVTDANFFNNSINISNCFGARNTDFERKTIVDSYKDGGTDKTRNLYYYPISYMASYSSIIDQNGNKDNKKSIKEALQSNPDLASKYYTALGRERYGMYRVQNNLSDVRKFLLGQT